MSIICHKDYSLVIAGGPLVLTASKAGGSKQGTSITLTATSNPPQVGTCFFSQGNFMTDPGWVDLGSAPFVAGVAVKVTSAMHVGSLPLVCYTAGLLFSNQVPMTVYTIVLNTVPPNVIGGKHWGANPFTYTAQVFVGATPLSGMVTFSDDIGTLGTAALAAGTATLVSPTQTDFDHVVTATYNAFDNGSASINVYVAPDIKMDAYFVSVCNGVALLTGSSMVFTGTLHYSATASAWLEVQSDFPSYGLVLSTFSAPPFNCIVAGASVVTYFQVTSSSHAGTSPVGVWTTSYAPSGYTPSNPTPWPPAATVTVSWA